MTYISGDTASDTQLHQEPLIAGQLDGAAAKFVLRVELRVESEREGLSEASLHDVDEL